MCAFVSNLAVASIQIYFEGGEIFSLTGRMGTKPEARRAEREDGVLGEGAASPLPTS